MWMQSDPLVLGVPLERTHLYFSGDNPKVDVAPRMFIKPHGAPLAAASVALQNVAPMPTGGMTLPLPWRPAGGARI